MLLTCKSIIDLAIEKEINNDQDDSRFWFIMNLVTRRITTILLVFSSYFYKKLHASKIIRRKCKNYLSSEKSSESWGKSMETTDAGIPTANTWYRWSITKNFIKNYRHTGDNNQLHVHQFTNP